MKTKMNPNFLHPVDPTQKPIELTSAQLAELDRKWAELFTPEFRRRDMVLTAEGSSERKSRLLALAASRSSTSS